MRRRLAIRPATESDIEAISRIASSAWRNTYRGLISDDAIDGTVSRWYSTEALRQRIKGHPVHVVEDAGAVVGYVQHGPLTETVHEVFAIYVAPSMLGFGIGWVLWQAVMREAASAGKQAVELWVLEGNRLGMDWYDRQGGMIIGRQEVQLADGLHGELRYRFRVTAPPE